MQKWILSAGKKCPQILASIHQAKRRHAAQHQALPHLSTALWAQSRKKNGISGQIGDKIFFMHDSFADKTRLFPRRKIMLSH